MNNLDETEINESSNLANGVSPLVRQIITLILKEIESLDKEMPLQPEIKLAEKFGISRKTIRSAMKRLEETGLIRRIKRKGTFPTKGRTCMPLFREDVVRIGLISSSQSLNSPTNYQSQIAMGVFQKTLQENAQILTAGNHDSFELPDSIFRIASDATVKGLILIGITDQTLLADLGKWNKPICLIDHYSDTDTIDCARTNSNKGSQLAVEHLYRLGHTKIGYANTTDTTANPSRFNGYKEGLKSWGLSYKKEWLFYSKNAMHEADNIAMQFLDIPPEKRPTAIIAFSDIIAKKIKDALTNFGLSIPRDLSIIGARGDKILKENKNDKIANICYDWNNLGQNGAELLLERLAKPRAKGINIQLSPTLDMGTTTAKL